MHCKIQVLYENDVLLPDMRRQIRRNIKKDILLVLVFFFSVSFLINRKTTMITF